MIFPTNRYIKQFEIVVLISIKIGFMTKNIIIDKEGHYIMIKGSIQQEIMIVHLYAPNIGIPNFRKQTLLDLHQEVGSNTVILRDFNTPLIQSINKRTSELNYTID